MHFKFANPYSSTRLPVFGRNVVATSHPLAAQAGLQMLAQGGNAADAAVAAAAALVVCEPVCNGLGGDALCMLWDGQQLHGLNASGRAPEAWTPEYFRAKLGPDATRLPQRGIDSVTVPGAVSAWVALNKRFGKLPLGDVLAPAIELAERGCLVPPVVQHRWAAAAPELQSQPGFAQTFLPFGRAPEVGELIRLPSVALALRKIAQSRGVAFYGGEIAHAIEQFSAAQGGALKVEDFERYQPEWVKPTSRSYRGYEVHEISSHGQGRVALVALGILSYFELGALGVDSVTSQHLQIEAMKLAFADVYGHRPAAESVASMPTQPMDDDYFKSRARLVRMNKAQDFGAGNAVRADGSCLTAADENGMMVSFIQSNYLSFGSGCVEPEFGISLHNRGHGFFIGPGGRQVAPGKRLHNTLNPAFVMKDGKPLMSYGVTRGNLQTLVRMLDYGQNPQTACDAPRWRYAKGLSMLGEPGMPASVVEGLLARGHSIEVGGDPYQDFGAGQFIWRAGDPKVEGYVAASDGRRDGQAVGF